MDILCGFTPIPEEDMFTGGPLKARYYDEQCLKNTKENSLYQYVPEVQKGSSKRCQLFEDFEESSSFSIDMMPQGNICSASPLQDISNLGRRPSTARARGQVRFFLDTEDQDQEQSSEDTFFQGKFLFIKKYPIYAILGSDFNEITFCRSIAYPGKENVL